VTTAQFDDGEFGLGDEAGARGSLRRRSPVTGADDAGECGASRDARVQGGGFHVRL
jgi:hypothetical protein